MKRNYCVFVAMGALTAAVATSAFAAEMEPVIDIKPLAGRVYGVRKAEATDASTIRVTLGASSTPVARKSADAWRVTSNDDADYAYEKFVKPLSVAEISDTEEFTYPARFTGVKKWRRQPAMKKTVVELKLPKPMKPGKKYGVVAMGVFLNERGDSECVTGAITGAFVGEDYQADGNAARIVGLRNVFSCGGGKILCELGNSFAGEAGMNPGAWTVKVNGAAVRPAALGRRSKLDYYLPCGWPFTGMMLHDVFIDLGRELNDGDKISVEVKDKVCSGNRKFEFTFDAAKSFTRSIQCNQVGYLPDGVKIAYLGQWMGSMADANSLHFATPPEFALVDAKTGKSVFTGAAKFVHQGGADEGRGTLCASDTWELDFSAFTTPGEYRISIAGVGSTVPFRIHKNVYAAAFHRMMQGIYEQRCGCELDPKLTGGWKRIACHADGVKETDVNRWEFNQYGPFQNRCTGKTIKASGGHHDAGDYNPRSHLDVAQALMDALQLKGDNFTDGQLGVPEKGNGIPDILDEALWQLKLWVGLQDADGGIYDGTESHADPNFFQTVELDDKGDYAFAKNCKAGYWCAGAFAQAATLLGKCGKKALADDFRTRAVKAYAWAAAHEETDAKRRQSYVVDPKMYADVHLYILTGDAKYHDDFKANSAWAKGGTELSSWGKYDQTRAGLAYLMIPKAKADAALREKILNAAKGEFNMYANGSSKCPYKFLRNPYAPISWGTGAYENYAVTCAHLYAHTGEKVYRDWLIRTCDNTLGANPLDLSFITGLGTRTVRCPLHNSRYRPEGTPVPGLQEQGPLQRGDGYSYRDSVFPAHNDNAAKLHAHADLHFAIAMDEPTVNNMANTALVFGLLLK